jgi:hypothetical protein
MEMLQKRIFQLLLPAFILFTGIFSSNAGGIPGLMPKNPIKPFFGVYYSYIHSTYSTFTDHFEYPHGGVNYTFSSTGRLPLCQNGFGFESGIKVNTYFGLLLGITHYLKKNAHIRLTAANVANLTLNTTNTVIARVAMNNAYFETRGYFPIFRAFDLVIGLGADFIDRSIKLNKEQIPFPSARNGILPLPNDDAAHQLHRLVWRFGAGAIYYLGHHFYIQTMLHYMPVPDASIVSNPKNFWTISTGIAIIL